MKDAVVEALLMSPHQNGDKLPSVRVLMQKLHAASGTIQSAIRTLKEKGLVYTDPGKGVFWGKRKTIAIAAVAPGPQETFFEKFQSDIRFGYFPLTESLPSQKELAARYRISPYMLRQYLKEACARGILEHKGKNRYNFPKQEKKSSDTEILFITRSTAWGSFYPASEREMDFLRFTYRLGAEKHYKLRLLGFDEDAERFVDRNGNVRHFSDYPNAVGAIVSTLLILKPFKLLHALLAANFPISIWWEHPANSLEKIFLKQDGWAFFNSSFGKNPGKSVGKFLKQQGISQIAYISPYHASSWSIDRLQGLRESGIEVVECVDSKYASPWDFRHLASQNGPKYTIELRAKKHEKEILRRLLKEIPAEMPWVTVNDEVVGLLRELEEEGELKNIPYLVGFDNSAESFLLRLDSFDFNTENLVIQMFYHLELGKNDPFRTGLLREIPGKVVEK